MSDNGFSVGQSGLARYVEQHAKCPECDAFMQVKREGGYGYFYLNCPACGKAAALETTLVDDFISASKTVCPKCGERLVAQSGTFGVFVKCEIGHIFRVVDV